MSEKTYSIYALRNKASGEVGYIGQTKNLDQRFKEHLAQINIEENSVKTTKKSRHSRPSNPRKIFWMYSNKDDIEIQELESGISSKSEADNREGYFILKYSKEGHPLTNVTSPIFSTALMFNQWNGAEALVRYPNGYSIASSHVWDFILVGKFLYLRDRFFDAYHLYVNGEYRFEQLKSVYGQMIKQKNLTEKTAKGMVNLYLSCTPKIRPSDRNPCSSIYHKAEQRFSWINNCMNLCAISVATSGQLQCTKRAVIYDVKSDLNLLSLKLKVLALSKINTETVNLLLSDETDTWSTKTKKSLKEFDKIDKEIEKLNETFESNQISIENYIIKIGVILIKKLGATPEELVFD
jgi:hypothetical protein